MNTRYTTAPDCYDGFSTHTVEKDRYQDKRGKPIRKVEFDDRDLNWQTMRYSSGMELCVDEAGFAELLGWYVTEVTT